MKIKYNGTQTIKHFKIYNRKKVFNVNVIEGKIIDFKISIEPTALQRIAITKLMMKHLEGKI